MSVRVMGLVWGSDVDGNARWVLLKLADCADDRGFNAFPAVATIAGDCRFAERTVQRALAELAEQKLIRVERAGGGRKRSTLYSIDLVTLRRRRRADEDDPVDEAGNPVRLSPFPEGPPGGETPSARTETPSTTTRNGDTAVAPEREEPSENHPLARASHDDPPSVDKPTVPERGGSGGNRGDRSRGELIEIVMGFALNRLSAELLVDGALDDISEAELYAVLRLHAGSDRDTMKRAVVGSRKRAQAERAMAHTRRVEPLRRAIDGLDRGGRIALLARINQARTAKGEPARGDFFAGKSDWLADQVLALGLSLEMEVAHG